MNLTAAQIKGRIKNIANKTNADPRLLMRIYMMDRFLVMYEGEIVGELDPKTTTPEELGLYMSGSKKNYKGGEN